MTTGWRTAVLVLCEDTLAPARAGACPVHGGDSCLVMFVRAGDAEAAARYCDRVALCRACHSAGAASTVGRTGASGQ